MFWKGGVRGGMLGVRGESADVGRGVGGGSVLPDLSVVGSGTQPNVFPSLRR